MYSRCNKIHGANGAIEPLDSEYQEKLVTEIIEPMASRGLRTISVAYKEIDGQPDFDDEESIINGLTCVCIVGIEDPVRPEV